MAAVREMRRRASPVMRNIHPIRLRVVLMGFMSTQEGFYVVDAGDVTVNGFGIDLVEVGELLVEFDDVVVAELNEVVARKSLCHAFPIMKIPAATIRNTKPNTT